MRFSFVLTPVAVSGILWGPKYESMRLLLRDFANLNFDLVAWSCAGMSTLSRSCKALLYIPDVVSPDAEMSSVIVM